MIAALAHVFRGFCMGSADVVPGVSGGTIALVLGIYERLVTNVRQGASIMGWLLRVDGAKAWRSFRRMEWSFLAPLLLGIAMAILLLARALDHLLEENPVEMSAIFFGLVAASSVAVWDRMRTRDGVRMLVMALAAVAAFVVLGIRGDAVSHPAWWFIVVAGAIAICAMILPGISGSFILLILGMYDYIIDAVNGRDVLTLCIFLIGAVAGLAVFAPILSAGLKRHHDTVMAALVGLMAGSLRVLWPWPEGVDNAAITRPPEALDLVIPFVLALGGAALVMGLMALDRRMAR